MRGILTRVLAVSFRCKCSDPHRGTAFAQPIRRGMMNPAPDPFLMSANATPHRRRWPWIVGFIIVVAAIAWWWFGMAKNRDANAARRPAGPTVVVTAQV